jgi:hypothetical protein
MRLRRGGDPFARWALAALALAFWGAAASPQESASPAARRDVPPAEEVYSNLQVLRGTPADQLLPAMEFVAASLGVACEHCHVTGSFAADDKPAKQVARRMMRMMAAINRESFEGRREVTCYSCHRGAARPATEPLLPVPAAAEPRAGAGVSPVRGAAREPGGAAELSAAQVFARHLAAAGGLEAARRVSSRAATGTLEAGGREFPFRLFQQAPLRVATVLSTPGGDTVSTCDGAAGAVAAPGRPLRAMAAAEVAAAVLANDFHWAARPGEVFSDRRVVGQSAIDGREVIVIQARLAGAPVELAFDAEEGLLRRILAWTETPLGRLPTRVDLLDYREVEGLKTPWRWTVSRPQGAYAVQLAAVDPEAVIDPGRFTVPRLWRETERDRR